MTHRTNQSYRRTGLARFVFDALVVVSAGALSLTACGGDGDEDADSAALSECRMMNADNADAVCVPMGGGDGDDGAIVGASDDDPANSGGIAPGVGGSDFAVCATGSASADVSPVSMMLVFDRSSSMNNDNKWEDSTAAVVEFLQDPETSGLSVGLRFFPDDEPEFGCNQDDCSIAACASPLVQSAPLTAQAMPQDIQEQALVDAIQARDAWQESRGTPMFPALGGALEWAQAYQGSHSGERAVVILVTDGEPNGCDDNINSIAGLAGDANDDGGVLTYAIGLEGSAEAQMDQIASQGGTGDGIFIGGGSSAGSDLLEALSAIRGQALGCDFPVPEGDDVNPDQVNIEVTTSEGSVTFLRADSEEDCGDETSWYYSGDQSQIHLCPAACNVALADPNAEVSLIFGCDVETLPGSMAR